MTTRLTVMGFTAADELEQARIEEASRAMPGVELVVDEGPLDEIAFREAVDRGTGPDLIYVDRDLIGAYAARGLIAPIDAHLDREGIDRHQFRDAALRQAIFRGATYGIPEYSDIQMLFLHLPALASVSVLPREIEFADWLHLPAANRELTLRFGSVLGRAGVDTGLPGLLPFWARANGADLLSADGSTAHLDDARVLEALDVARQLIDDQGGWAAVSAFHDELEFFGPDNPFARNRAAVMAIDASYLDVLAEHSPHLEFAIKPVVDRWGAVLACPKGSAWAVPTSAADPARSFAAAWAMSRPETWVVGARARAVAAHERKRRFDEPYTANKVADLAIWKTVAEPSGMPMFDTAVQVIRTYQEIGFVVPPCPAPREVRAAWTAGVKRAMSGHVLTAVAMREANQRAQAAIDAAA
jgi:multiple sugar transport system substrate-binding protein